MQTATPQEAFELSDLRAVEALVAERPDVLSVSTLRWQLRHRDTNGLAAACVQIGKRLLISKSRYERWLATKTEAARGVA